MQTPGQKRASTLRSRHQGYQRLLRDLEGSPDKERVILGQTASNEKVRFICQEHGIYLQTVANHLNGHGCPKCAVSRRATAQHVKRRANNPFPQWFLNDFEGSPDKEAILSGKLTVNDKAHFTCQAHGLYLQKINDHLAGRSCQKCVQGSFRSSHEIELEKYLKSKGIRVEHNVPLLERGQGRNYEVDLWLPDYAIAVELNGYYYHHSSPTGKAKTYHKEKTELALRQGVKLFHFGRELPLGLIKSVLMAKLGKLKRVVARTLLVRQEKHSEFFEYNHIDGACKCEIQWSLVTSDNSVLASLPP